MRNSCYLRFTLKCLKNCQKFINTEIYDVEESSSVKFPQVNNDELFNAKACIFQSKGKLKRGEIYKKKKSCNVSFCKCIYVYLFFYKGFLS